MTIACSKCGVTMEHDSQMMMFVCPLCEGWITDEEVHRQGLLRPRLDPPCPPPRGNTMTNTPASSADSATSSQASRATASSGTHPLPDEVSIDFTFKRVAEKVVIAGTKPYVLMTLHDKGVSITGGGLPPDAPEAAVVEFLIAAGDTFHDMAKSLSEKMGDEQ